jgi:hypothetical protein
LLDVPPVPPLSAANFFKRSVSAFQIGPICLGFRYFLAGIIITVDPPVKATTTGDFLPAERW